MSTATGLHLSFVLHQRPYRETSTLTDLFTEAEGRVSLVIRGSRRQSRRGASSGLALFRPYWVSWHGQGELGTLKSSEPVAPASPLTGDALYAGLYANELLLRFCARSDPHPELFHVYQQLLLTLSQGSMPIDATLRYFERDLLADIGYGLNLEHDTLGDALIADRRYDYQPELGARPLPDTAHQVGVAGATLLALAAGTLFEQDMRQEARRLLRAVIQPLLGNRPLSSLDTYRRMKAMQKKSMSGTVSE